VKIYELTSVTGNTPFLKVSVRNVEKYFLLLVGREVEDGLFLEGILID